MCRRNGSEGFKKQNWARQYRWAMNNEIESCRSCGSRNNLTFAHIIAWILGGPSTRENLTILCIKCNRKDGISLIQYPPLTQEEFYWKNLEDLKENDITMWGSVKEVEPQEMSIKVVFNDEQIFFSNNWNAKVAVKNAD